MSFGSLYRTESSITESSIFDTQNSVEYYNEHNMHIHRHRNDKEAYIFFLKDTIRYATATEPDFTRFFLTEIVFLTQVQILFQNGQQFTVTYI